MHDCARRFVFVKQVSPEQHKIHLILTRKLQNLFKRVHGVTAPDWVHMLKPEVDVCSDENFESIVVLVLTGRHCQILGVSLQKTLVYTENKHNIS